MVESHEATQAKRSSGSVGSRRGAAARAGLAPRVTGFYREWITEMKKVTWPGRKDTMSSTAVVIVVVLIIVAFLGLVDFALGRITQSILSF